MAMDELELLKKDWRKKDSELPKLSYDDIYKMRWKKSSSIVKWIFYISIIEFVFWVGLNSISLGDSETVISQGRFSSILTISLQVVSYLVLAFFIYRFYSNYRKINTTDSARELMKNIIKTRKTVMRYVWISLALFAISMLLVFIDAVFFNENYQEISQRIADTGSPIFMWILVFGVLLLTIGVVVGLLWLFYRLIYGILLKKLNVNYKELHDLKF